VVAAPAGRLARPCDAPSGAGSLLPAAGSDRAAGPRRLAA